MAVLTRPEQHEEVQHPAFHAAVSVLHETRRFFSSADMVVQTVQKIFNMMNLIFIFHSIFAVLCIAESGMRQSSCGTRGCSRDAPRGCVFMHRS